MNFFKFFRNTIGQTTSDYNGWQNNVPMAQTIENTQNYSPDKALQIPVVWACIDLLSRTVASLPCDVFSVQKDGSRLIDTKCNLAYVLSRSPNYSMTCYEFIQTLVMHWSLRGNAYALIVRNNDKTVKALYPLNPDQMNVFMDDNGVLTYHYYTKNNEYVDYKAEQILHWKCLGNGVMGLSKLEFMRASVTESATAQGTAVDLYSKKGKMNGVLTANQTVTDKQKKDIITGFAAVRDGGIGVLPASMTFQQLSLSPAQSQLLETRRFGVEEICRWFGIPSALVNSDGGAPGSNLEQVTANFYKSTILPMCISLEQAIMKRVPCIEEKVNHQVIFRLSFLNRASDSARSSINAQAVQNGWKTRNEVRREEGLAPVKNGDVLTAQSNLQPLDMLGTANASQVPQNAISTEPIKQ